MFITTTTKGDNKVPDRFGQSTVGYAAGTGYDQASGLGSFDADALVNNWQSASAALSSTITLKLAAGQTFPVVHGAPITFTATVKCSGTGCAVPTGTVSITATSATGSDSIVVGANHLNLGATSNSTTSRTATFEAEHIT